MSPWDPRRPSDEHDDTPYDDTPSPQGSPSPETADMSRTPTPDLPRLPELGDDDLERLLRGAFEERTRAEVPDDRVPPAVEWPSARAARRTWLTPLAVAASIAVVAAGGGLALAQQHRTQEAPPATQTVTAEPTSASPTSSTGTPSTTATGTATGTATATGTGTVAPPATSSAPSSATTTPAQRVTAGSATLLVPAGYTVTQKSAQGAAVPTWCLNSPGTADCVITFIDYHGTTSQALSSDTPGGYAANPEYCGAGVVDSNPTKPGTSSVQLVDYSEGQWSGRAAEFRHWRYDCTDGTTYDVAQYTVMTAAPYGLFTEKASADVIATMAQVVAGSTLPPATSSVRLYDHGIVRSVTTAPDGSAVIAVDRVVIGRANGSTQTYPYTVPSGTTFPDLKGGPAPLTAAQLDGRTVTLTTDGSVVTEGYAS
ncbi:hypothetical protein [Lapillicoccus jejuensis]|uniref:Uncharacterized protein n=1 Tax=Lapillicoccus jejuensis TaxID=402171 RepID=A0A542E0M6_9MICO|nr:hypothetical protein [Lapillicoccus jejuensis]TQJ08744.1 hypothetical protein FB458_1836 [Lapillicoccus jejuensis]